LFDVAGVGEITQAFRERHLFSVFEKNQDLEGDVGAVFPVGHLLLTEKLIDERAGAGEGAKPGERMMGHRQLLKIDPDGGGIEEDREAGVGEPHPDRDMNQRKEFKDEGSRTGHGVPEDEKPIPEDAEKHEREDHRGKPPSREDQLGSVVGFGEALRHLHLRFRRAEGGKRGLRNGICKLEDVIASLAVRHPRLDVDVRGRDLSAAAAAFEDHPPPPLFKT